VNLPGLFIRRPVATTLLTLAIALVGIAAYFVLPVAPLPQVDFPTIQVNAQFAGASPEVMAATVATPLERSLGEIADVSQMTSSSSQRGATGQTNIVLQFGLDRDINGAARDVEAAINAAYAYLPTNLNSKPTYRKTNPADRPIMLLALTSDTLTAPQVYDAADVVINQALSQVDGVGEVDVFGGASPSVRAEMNPYALNNYGIGLEDVRAALSSTNAFTPKGSYSDGERRYQIYTNDQATRAQDYADVIVAYRNGAPVRLRDVATVYDGPQDIFNLGLANGKQAIVVRVQKSPGANVISTNSQIRALLPKLEAEMGPAVKVTIMSDASKSIRGSVDDVERTLLIAVILVVLVVLVFLRNGKATLIPGVAVVVSLIGTLAGMYAFHYTLDNLSLMSLTVATGFVVDDAIVVLENITRHVENGMGRFEAALYGAKEVSFTVVSMSIGLIAVFIPILAMGGVPGRLFREFAVTLSISIVISLILSLTATPTMAARLIDDHHGVAKRRRTPWGKFWGRAADGLEWGFDQARGTYEKSLAWALDNSLLVLCMLITTICLTVFLYIKVPKGLFPQEDTGTLIGGVQVDQASSFKLTSAKFRRLQGIVMHDPAVQDALSFVQNAGGFMYVTLKPPGQRPGVTSDMVIGRMRPKLMRIPGANLFLQSAQDLSIGGRQSNAQYQYTLQSDDLTALRTWSNKLLEELKKYPDLTDVNTDQQNNALESYVTVDRASASRLGLNSQQIDRTLYDAYGQSVASIIYNPENQYHVVMEVDQKYQGDPTALSELYVTPPVGSSTTTAATPTPAGGSGGMRVAIVNAGASVTPAAALTYASLSGASSSTSSATTSTTGSTSGTGGVSVNGGGGGGGGASSGGSGSGGGSSASGGAMSASAGGAMPGGAMSGGIMSGGSMSGGSMSGGSMSGSSTSGGASSGGSGSGSLGIAGLVNTALANLGTLASSSSSSASGRSGTASASVGGGASAVSGAASSGATASSATSSGASTASGVNASATSSTSSNAGSSQPGGARSGAGHPRSTTGGAVTASTGVAISTARETMVPLSAVASWALQNTPLQVNHQNTSVAATLSFNLAPGKSLSDAQRDVENAKAAIGMPNTVVGSFQGAAQTYTQSRSTEPLLIASALIAVYIVLGVLYESYIHPLTVLSTLPSAGVGAVLAMMIFGIDFSLISLIGVILLIGIVKKNAIMIIDFALQAEREQGLSSRDSIYQACVLRFRPILMTTCAAILGALPLALGIGQGGELRQPLGIAIIGGLIASQILTLITTPVVYLYLDRLNHRRPRRYPRALPRGGGAAGPALQPAE
jgi:multidrug efflux pump